MGQIQAPRAVPPLTFVEPAQNIVWNQNTNTITEKKGRKRNIKSLRYKSNTTVLDKNCEDKKTILEYIFKYDCTEFFCFLRKLIHKLSS
jgi:hypothetical protein